LIKAKIGQKAPLFIVSDWVQGEPTNFDQLEGKAILVEVFQVNCPGCFLYALPQAIDLHQTYADKGLAVLGIATAFEDFDLNTLENLHKLINHSEVIGETFHMLNQHGILKEHCLPYRIPFPLAMDKLIKREPEVNQDDVITFINEHIPAFDQQPDISRDNVITQVRTYLEKLIYRPQTFELFQLKGTPSHILVDKKGILRECSFGTNADLELRVQELLAE
jgi:thiol-disulfide isomerase/thioredoxin